MCDCGLEKKILARIAELDSWDHDIRRRADSEIAIRIEELRKLLE